MHASDSSNKCHFGPIWEAAGCNKVHHLGLFVEPCSSPVPEGRGLTGRSERHSQPVSESRGLTGLTGRNERHSQPVSESRGLTGLAGLTGRNERHSQPAAGQ